ncbi:MAG: ribonuclease D [Acidimicrobiales bacterium]
MSTGPLMVTGEAGLDALVARLLGVDGYALDTEFHRERTYWPKLALVQVAWPAGSAGPAGVALVDPLAIDIAPLSKVLAGPAVMVAHAAEQDLEVLAEACGRLPGRLFDTQIAAGFAGQGSAGLSALMNAFLGVDLPKGDRLTDWRRRPLTDSQISYAAADVENLLDLAGAITDALARAGRLGWAEEECEALRTRPRPGTEPSRAWWKLRDARQLKGRSRGVAQEVTAWRERRAQQIDRPPRTVLPDLAVQAIAHRPPASADALRHVRGLEGRGLKLEVAAQVFAAVEAGRSLPEADLEIPPSDDVPREARASVSLLMAWVGQLARNERIDAALLATRADLAAYLRGDPDARLAQGWRAKIVAEPVRALVDGNAALAFDGSGELVLETRSGHPL